MDEHRRAELLLRFYRHPLLQLLVMELWFRWLFFLLLGVVVLTVLFLLKIWTVSPRDFKPVIKISALDFVQAWSLKRTATQAMAQGKDKEAAYAWRSAIGNNPADPESVRGGLRHLLLNGQPDPKLLREAVGHTVWLLRLTGTNQVDVALTAKVYEKFRLYDLLHFMLAPRVNHLNPEQEVLYLKALFNLGHMRQFAVRWEKLPPEAQREPELALHRAAYLAGWGSPTEAGAGRQQLAAALANPSHRQLANRLHLAVHAHLGELDRYASALKRLEESWADTLLEHIEYWHLMAAAGRKEEAKSLALTHPITPVSALETIRLAEVYTELGLADYAEQFLKLYAPQFSFAPGVWITYGNLLIETKRWEELRALALQIRTQKAGGETLVGYSYFLEGRAQFARGHRQDAEASFKKITRYPMDHTGVALVTASSLTHLGFPAMARELLLGLEKMMSASSDFWFQLFSVGHLLKDMDLMYRAAVRAYELQPANAVFMNNYAAVLLLRRERTEEIIKLTLQLLAQKPGSHITRINHSLALILNQRPLEAAQLLKSIQAPNLTSQEAAAFYLCWLEIFMSQKKYEQAWEAIDRIDKQYLLSPQIQWLDQARQQLPARSAPKA